MEHQKILSLTALGNDEQTRNAWQSVVDDYNSHLERLITSVEILNLIKSTKLYKYPGVDVKTYLYPILDTLAISIYHATIEFVINEWCGLLHRTFDIDWEMQVFSSEIDLCSIYKEVKIRISVYEGDFKSCTIKHIEVEPPPWDRTIAKYVIECPEDEDK